jgi:hypothetical protein
MIALLMAAVVATAPADLVGLYDGGQMEIAAGLELRADGKFQYGLAYGALDEEAEGSWTVEGDHVLLTTEPAVVPPRFSLAEQKAAATPGAIEVSIVDPKGRALPNIDIAVTYGEGDPDIVQSREEPVVLPLDASRPPRSIVMAIPVFDVESDLFAVDAAKGTSFTFRFEPNGLGHADFRHTPLAIEKGVLVLPRFDRTLRFERR